MVGAMGRRLPCGGKTAFQDRECLIVLCGFPFSPVRSTALPSQDMAWAVVCLTGFQNVITCSWGGELSSPDTRPWGQLRIA